MRFCGVLRKDDNMVSRKSMGLLLVGILLIGIMSISMYATLATTVSDDMLMVDGLSLLSRQTGTGPFDVGTGAPQPGDDYSPDDN
jgi:hypothetical protein